MSAAEQAAKWARMPLLAFDTETTGVDVFNDRIVQAAVVKVAPEERPQATSWLADPGIDIPQAATDVHGITTDHARTHGMDPGQMLFELTGRLAIWLGHGKPIVGMNLAYDLTLLEAENRRHGIDTLHDRLGPGKIGPIIDVYVLDKHVDKFRKGGRKLEQICEVYGVRHVGAHDATGDALAAARIFPRLMAKHAETFRGFTLAALHQAQIGWRRQQQISLAQYFARQGDHEASASCSTEWPIQSPPRPVETVEPQGSLL